MQDRRPKLVPRCKDPLHLDSRNRFSSQVCTPQVDWVSWGATVVSYSHKAETNYTHISLRHCLWFDPERKTTAVFHQEQTVFSRHTEPRRMWELRVAPVSISLVSLSILTSMLKQRLSSKESELYSEILCWAFLPIWFKIKPLKKGVNLIEAGVRHLSSISSWIVALSVVLASLYTTEHDLVELFVSC